MFKINNIENTITGGAMIIALFSIFSRLLGLFRDRLLSSSFGAGEVLDAYYAAFRLPDLIFHTLVLGALSAAFIPVFLEYFSYDKEQAWRITNSVLNILFLIIFFFTALFFILAPILIPFLVPGFSEGVKDLTISLTRIMLIGILFFTLSNVAGSVLNSFRKFVAYSIAPVMYNIGIIIGIVIFTKTMGVLGLAWGVALGSVLHFLIQVPALIKTGYRWKPLLEFTHPALKRIVTLMVPRCFGLIVSQLNFIVVTFIASFITIGAVAVYNLAFNLVNVPVSIFGISLAISLFPLLSKTFAIGDHRRFRKQFSKAIGQIFYLIIPTTILFIALRAQIVRIILGAGAFTWRDTILTYQTLGFFSLSLFAQSLIPIFAKAFYAAQDTKTPVKIAFISFIINAIGAAVFSHFLGVKGLALAFSIASIVQFGLLYVYLDKKVVHLKHKQLMYSVARFIGASILMVIIVQIIKYTVGSVVNMQTFAGVFTQALLAAIGGIAFYVILSLLFKFKEVEVLYTVFAKKLAPKKKRLS
ncbi:murein biosynthesis integral membrane protein MurJ [Patescibacteria group bacterium AH-259-L05]|nr:murein biosynthesis integral membrane protein MurJ [Patescibacteria group bacterium AH-259-L05]